MAVVSYEIKSGVGIIRLNNPPVNALSQVLREGIQNAVVAAQGDESQVLLIVCEGRTFVAGADITEFGKPAKAPSLPSILDSIENSVKPVIAAIHGTALGGGFEIALAAHYRCALASAKVGLPEVKLGIIPGAGGTQRTPRIIGVDAALDMITSGNPVAAAKAHSMGLVDHIINGDLLEFFDVKSFPSYRAVNLGTREDEEVAKYPFATNADGAGFTAAGVRAYVEAVVAGTLDAPEPKTEL